MNITAHAIIRYLERVEGRNFEAERAVCAAELGLISVNALTCARFLRWLREHNSVDYRAVWLACAEAIRSGRIMGIDLNGTVVTVVDETRAGYIPTRTVDPWRDPVSRAARRRILKEEALAAESYRTMSPRNRRSRSTMPAR